jgi:hypothetical protein
MRWVVLSSPDRFFPWGNSPYFRFNKKHGGWAPKSIWKLNRSSASTRDQIVIARSNSPKHNVAGVIPQSLQLQAQVKIASRSWRHKSGECAKSCARESVCFCNQSSGGTIIFCSDSSCNDVTGRKVVYFVTLSAKCCLAKWLGFCGFNSVIII